MAGMRAFGRISAACVGVLLVVALAFLAQPARAATSKPTWAAGDFWVYSYRASVPGQSFTGTLRFDVVGTDSVTLNGTSYSSYRTKASFTLDAGGVSVTYRADVWYSVDTLAIAQISTAINITTSIVITIWGNPPQSIHWPLTTGDTWTSTTQVTIRELFTANGTSLYNYAKLSTRFDVLADASITVPAGTFTTTPLKETATGSTSYSVNYWSPQAGNSVKNEAHNSSGGPQGSYNLTSYNYQSGSFFTTVFIGLPVWIWLIVVALILVTVIGAVVIRRRRPPVAAPPPGWAPPQPPPSGPQPPPESPP